MARVGRGLTAAALLAAALALAGCGAKTELRTWDAEPVPPECQTDEDCSNATFCDGEESCHEGRCVPGAPVACTDGVECTDDACDELRRACVHNPASRDADGDGYNGPRPGYRPAVLHACGDDCDDTNPRIHPGATEICNGIDDNCNGIIDDNATFTPAEGSDVPVSDVETAPSGPGGIAWSGSRYMSSFWGYTGGKAHVYYSALDRAGARLSMPPQIQLTLNQSDAYGAAVAWTGTVLGIVWQDRRDGDYEIYFNRLTPDGETLGPSQRVTFANGFSINPSIAWTGTDFLLAWQDERDSVGTGAYEIYAQRIDAQGRQIAENQRITNDPANSEAPMIAAGASGAAIVWLDGRGGDITNPTGSRGIWFATFTNDLRRMLPDQRVTAMGLDVVAPTLAWNRDRWVLAWHDAAPDSADFEVWGTTRDAGGVPIVPPLRLTTDRNYSRYPNLVPLGDRLLLTWADDRASGRYAIWARMFDANLSPITAATQVTHGARASVWPIATLGPEGDVGILFRDQREGPWRVRFTRLQCAIPR